MKNRLIFFVVVFLSITLVIACSATFRQNFSSYQKKSFEKNRKILHSQWIFKSQKDPRHFENISTLFQYGSPYFYKDHIYFGLSDGYFYKVETHSGNLAWKIKLGESIQSDVVVHDDIAYFGDLEGKIYAIEVRQGKILWTYRGAASFLSQALVLEDEVAFLLSNETVLFLDKSKGSFIWNYERRLEKTAVYGNSIPVYENGIIYGGFSDGSFVALKESERALLWERALGNDYKFSDIDARALIDGEKIYVMTYGGDLYALEKTQGSIIWKAKDIGGIAHMALYAGKLYASTTNGKLYRIDTSNGIAEHFYKNSYEGEIFTGPVVFDNYIITGGSRTGMYVFSPDLQLVETYLMGTGIIGELATDDKGSLYGISNYGNVYKLIIK